jgi:hypothetical protein
MRGVSSSGGDETRRASSSGRDETNVVVCPRWDQRRLGLSRPLSSGPSPKVNPWAIRPHANTGVVVL